MIKTERINVNITRIVSPTEFWLRLQTDKCNNEPYPFVAGTADEQEAHCDNLRWIKERAEWKCHLAFLFPIDSIEWSLTSIDKFKTYAKQYEKLAVTIPNSINSSTRSTAVILWGSCDQSANESDALEAEFNVWQNISLKMIFQGLARSNVHIGCFSIENFVTLPNDECQVLSAKQNHTEGNGKEKGLKKLQRWLPALPCRNKKFNGTTVFIDKKLEIYVQESENERSIEHISNQLTAWHKNRTKNPSKLWQRGDICVAQRSSDGKYHRAEIQRVYQKQRKCLVQFVDFGCIEAVPFGCLSAHTKFTDVPIQVRKCHLWDVILISDEQTVKAVELCNRMMYNQISTFFIQDNIDSLHFESTACSVKSLDMELDLSSLLISLGLVRFKTHLNSKLSGTNDFQEEREKRIRKKSDESIQKSSSELLTIEDFKKFYEANKIEFAVNNDENNTNNVDDGHRIFEIFESPSRRNPLGETVLPEIQIDAHPIVDRITEHFGLLNVTELAFYCRPVLIMNPVTVLINVDDTDPPIINPIQERTKYFPMEEYSSCIAFENYAWHRGIVWKKVSTNKYFILFVDTLKISEINRKWIQTCPTELLGSRLPLTIARLTRIKPNERMRARDICDELSINIMNKDLYAKVVGAFDNGVLDVKLYETKEAKRTIYSSLIKRKFYKRV